MGWLDSDSTAGRSFQWQLDQARSQAGDNLGNWVGSLLTAPTTPFGARGNYSRQQQDSYISEAGWIGAEDGRNLARQQFRGPQVAGQTGFWDGSMSRARMDGFDEGYYGNGFTYSPRNHGWGHQPQPVTRGWNYTQPMPQQYHSQGNQFDSRDLNVGQQSGQSNSYVFQTGSGKFNYVIDNGPHPLSPEQQHNIGVALARIQSVGGANEARDLEIALANGLSPHAIIVRDHGRGKDRPMDMEEFVRKGMMFGDQKRALDVLENAERTYTPPPSQQGAGQNMSGAQVAGMLTDPNTRLAPVWNNQEAEIGDRPGLNELNALVNTAPGQLLVNGQRISAGERMAMITGVLNSVDANNAAHFNQQLINNPNFMANFQNLGAEAAREQGGGEQVANASAATFKAFSVAQGASNWPQAAQATAQGLYNNPNAASVMQRYEAQPSTDELQNIHIGDPALEEKLRKAVAQQASWDKMVGDNPIAGFFMMLLRPLMQAMNPGSDPMAVLAEAANRQPPVEITAGTEQAANKLRESLGTQANITIGAGAAPAPEQAPPAKAGEAPEGQAQPAPAPAAAPAQGAADQPAPEQTAGATIPPQQPPVATPAPAGAKAGEQPGHVPPAERSEVELKPAPGADGAYQKTGVLSEDNVRALETDIMNAQPQNGFKVDGVLSKQEQTYIQEMSQNGERASASDIAAAAEEAKAQGKENGVNMAELHNRIIDVADALRKSGASAGQNVQEAAAPPAGGRGQPAGGRGPQQ